MTSDQQLIANRNNALKSTGPRSLFGKSRSRMNAVRHGVTAEHVLLPGEDRSEYNALRSATFNSLFPQGALENQLVERAVSLIWRMRRIPSFEVALFEWTAYYHTQVHDAPVMMTVIDDDPDNAPRLTNDTDNLKPLEDLEDGLKLGRVIEVMLNADVTARLTRYEMGMQRNLSATLKELRELAKSRPPILAVPPITSNQS